MAIVSDVEIRLRADIARLQQDMTAARRSVDNGMQGITRAVELAKKAMAAFGVGMGVKELVSQVIGAQREFDKLNASLVTATGSSANAAQAFKALQGFAATTPYSVSEATDAFIKLRNLGLSPSEAAMRSYGNTSAAMGKSLNQMIEAVADAATGQFERLKEFGITAKQNGDKVSLTFQGVTKNIGNNAKDIQKYLRDIGDVNFNGAMEARAATLDGAISNLGDTWESVLRSISSNGFGEGVMAGVLALSGALTDLSAIIDAVGGAASKEGQKVQEAAGLHKVLTETFKGVAAVGVLVAAAFQEVGQELAALAALATAASNRDWAGMKSIVKARQEDMASLKTSTEAKINAIGKADVVAAKARDKEAAALKASGKDQLADYEIVLTAQQKKDKADQDTLELRNKLNGVNAQTVGDLAKLKTALDTGAISQQEYNKYVAHINKDTAMASTAYKDAGKALDLSTEAVKRREQAQIAANKADQEQLDFLHRTGQMTDESFITKQADAEVKALGEQKKALQDQQALLKSRYDTEAARAALATQIEGKDQDIAAAKMKREHALEELELKSYREALAHTADLIDAAKDETLAQQGRTRDMQDEIDALGLTSQQLAEVTAARLRDRAAALDRRAEIGIIEEVNEALRAQANELRKQADLGLTKERVQEQQKFWSSIEQTAHDTFVSIGDGGKAAWQRLKDSAKNMFFDWLYQMTLKKWIINIGATVSGDSSVAGLVTNGVGSLFGGSSGGGSGGMSAMNLISMGKTIYSGFSAGITSTMGGYVTTLGNTFGSSAVSAFGAGMSGGSGAGAVMAELGQGTATGAAATANAGAVGASSAGYAIPIAGWIAFGMSMSDRMYKQGWDANNGSVNSLGKVVNAPMFLGNTILKGLGMSNSAANVLSGMGPISKLFGRKNPKIQSQGIEGTFDSSGFSGDNFAKIIEEGGWFRSDKKYTKTADLDPAQDNAYDNTMRSMLDSVKGFASVLGVSADTITGYSKKIELELTGDAAKDQAAITKMFGDIGDELSTRLVPSLAQFQKEGESASATLQRIVGDFQTVDAVMESLGRTFGQVGLDSVAARERLIDLSGGMDAFVASTAYFQQNFYSDADKVAAIQKPLQESLAGIGMASLQTTEQFKNAVLALDLTTEKGAQQYATLMALAPQFKVVADYMAQAGAAAAQAAKDAAAALEERRAATEEMLRGLVDDSLAAVGRAVDAQKNKINAAFDASMKSFDASISTVNDTIASTGELSKALKSGLAAAPGENGAAREQAARAQITAALTIAKASGVLPSTESMADALATATQDSSDNYTTLAEYQRAVARTNADLEALGGLTDNQLSAAQTQLQVLQAAKDAAQVQHDEDIARLDAMLTSAQAQVDAINGVNNSVLTIPAALAALQVTLGALKSAPTATGSGIVKAGTTVEDLYQQVLGRAGDAAGLAYWKQIIGDSVSQTEYLDFVKGAQPELQAALNGPPTVTTASGTMSGSSAMLGELQTLNSRMERVETSMNTTAKATDQFAQQFHQVSGGGNILATESV